MPGLAKAVTSDRLDDARQAAEAGGGALDVRVHAAALYVALIKNGYFDEATEFAEWYLDTFDHDLET